MADILELALKAKIPFISIQTDDLVNVEYVLQSIAKQKVAKYSTKLTDLGDFLYFTRKDEHADPDIYKFFVKKEKQLVFINCKPNNLFFDTGILKVPDTLIIKYLNDILEQDQVSDILKTVKGLSLKVCDEVCMLTQARVGHISPAEVRRTRSSIHYTEQGLYPVDTEVDYYKIPEELSEWLKINTKYFLGKAHKKLVPRGILFDGHPGTGKTMGAKAIANTWKIPLYRLDVSTVLNKYLGESEARMWRILSQVEKEAPCVLLIDEVEKIFFSGGEGSTGTTERLLSMLLFWLQEHNEQIFTVMTTNKIGKIPPELYRPGRIDRVFKINKLQYEEAVDFAKDIMKNVMGVVVNNVRLEAIKKSILETGKPEFAHSEICELVYMQVKTNDWVTFLN